MSSKEVMMSQDHFEDSQADESSLELSDDTKYIQSDRQNQLLRLEEDEDSNKSQKEQKHFLHISIHDSGSGMSVEMKKKCFTLFGNLKFKQEINQGGIGLGLASSSLLCKALGGFIEY